MYRMWACLRQPRFCWSEQAFECGGEVPLRAGGRFHVVDSDMLITGQTPRWKFPDRLRSPEVQTFQLPGVSLQSSLGF